MRLSGFKLFLVVRDVESLCQNASNIEHRSRILREQHGRVGDVQLRGFQGTHLGGVRLIQQDQEFAENSTRLPFIGLTAYPVDVGQQKPRAMLSGHFRRSSQPIALVKWHYGGLFLMPLGIVWGNGSLLPATGREY